MEKIEVIKSIGKRTGGDIYLGVVGAVRTGKSTFIRKFMENLVIPNIEDEYERKTCLDELPQAAAGKTIMTTEPKFVPATAAKIKVEDFSANIRMIDCVGYVVKAAKGYEDENGPRLVVTTDGSIGDIPRSEYVEAEKTVIEELNTVGKPYIVLLNSVHPMLPDTEALAGKLKEEYNVPVMPISIEAMQERDMYNILKEALYEFPIEQIKVNMPEWIAILAPDHYLKKEYISKIKEAITEVNKLKDIDKINNNFTESEYIAKSYISEVDPSTGEVTINLEAPQGLYSKTLNDIMGISVSSKAELLSLFQELNIARREYNQIKSALKMVKQTGYGIASPTLDDMKLDKPEIIKQGSRYGIKLKAKASSIHMIKVDVESTFEPIIGSELQSKELINYLTENKEGTDIWKSEIFGRSLDVIVQEGIQAKLSMMPDNVRYKLCQTLTKIINKGSSNMIAIVL